MWIVYIWLHIFNVLRYWPLLLTSEYFEVLIYWYIGSKKAKILCFKAKINRSRTFLSNVPLLYKSIYWFYSEVVLMLIPIALTYIAKWSWFFVLFFLFVLKTENELFLRNQRGNDQKVYPDTQEKMGICESWFC